MPAWATGALWWLHRRTGPRTLLGLVLVFAAALRWNGLDWDQGHVFHPDERHILMTTAGLALPLPPDWSLLLSPASPLNPHSFAYGSLPFYLLKLITHLLASLGQAVPFLEVLRPFSDFDHLRLVGRALSGLFDVGSVALAYFIGCRLRNRRTGLLAAAFLAVTVINVQYAHFYASDTLLTFFVLATTLLSLDLVHRESRRAAILSGITLGLALATKSSALPLVAVVGGAHLLRLFAAGGMETAEKPSLRWRVPSPEALARAAGLLATTLLCAVVVFVAVEPYALIDLQTFARNFTDESNMARGISDLPYTRQYANTTPYTYFLGNLALWGMGLPLGLVVLGGALATLVKTARRPSKEVILLIVWAVTYFAIVGSFHAKFLRYLLPLTPFLCLLAAYALTSGRFWPAPRSRLLSARSLRAWLRPALVAPALITVALAGGIWYALAFANIYGQEHTAVRASEWIYQNVPAKSRLLTEHWEEGLPVPVTIDGAQYDPGRLGYQNLSFPGYEPDSPAKFRQIAQLLGQADYVLFFSNRLYDTIPRLPERYPITSKYYELLFGEQLGFRLAAYFTAYPSLFGVTLVEDTFGDPRLPVPAALADFAPSPISIVLGKADESFSVYDHPKVMIFKKERAPSEGELATLFGAALVERPLEPGATIARPGVTKSLLLTDGQRAANSLGGTFRELFAVDGFESRFPVVVWLALLVVLGLLGLPFAFAVFRRLPDRGYLLARPLAILVLVWLDWMLVSLGLLQNTRATAFLALFLVAAASAYLGRRQWPELRQFWLARRREIVTWEALFWAAFALFLIIRLGNPDLWHPARGGEKPMDLAYLMAAIKSATFPPYDPWFAGGYLNYYYYGQIAVSTLVKLAGIVPTTAYNLVVPLLFALTAGGAFSAGYNLVSRRPWGEARRAGPGAVTEDNRAIRSHSPSEGVDKVATAGGIGAAAMAMLFGNLGGALQLLEQLAQLGATPFRSQLPGVEGLAAIFAGLWRLFVLRQPLAIGTDWYWASTRVIDGTINEFPFFTFLYADLHAHMIALPFTLLAIGLAINVVKSIHPFKPKPIEAWRVDAEAATNSAEIDQVASERAALAALDSGFSVEGILRLLIPALVIGALMPINSWDFPTYLALYGAALLVAWYFARPLSARRLAWVVVTFSSLLAAGYLLYWPFHSGFQQWYLGVDTIKDKSNVDDYLRIHGLFLFAILGLLIVETRARFGHTGALRTIGQWWRHWQRLPRLIPLQRSVVKRPDATGTLAGYATLAVLFAMFILHLLGMTLVSLLFGLLLWTGVLAVKTGRAWTDPHGETQAPERTFVLVLVAAGLALSIMVELVALKGDIGRMNTVFKFYIQVWVLWSVAAAFALVQAWRSLSAARPRAFRRLWVGGLTLLVLGALVYPVIGGSARVRDRYDNTIPSGLDGTEYMRTATFREENPETKRAAEMQLASDLAAMRWMQENVVGSPVILEAWAPLYHWGARYSIYTGLPTVIGWDWHQKQQRWGYQVEVDRRIGEVRAIYSNPEVGEVMSLLAKYDVRYVVVGDLERAMYHPAGLAKFDQMVGRYLQLVYDNQGVKIYRRLLN